MITTEEKERVKDTLSEMLKNEPQTFKELMEEILGKESFEDKKFEDFLKNSFARFETTYKALA